MGIVIVCAVLGILFIIGVISPIVYACSVFCAIAFMVLNATLYFKSGFMKWYYHGILGWHVPDDGEQNFDGCSAHATCRHCKKDIMQDSQGNWFTFD